MTIQADSGLSPLHHGFLAKKSASVVSSYHPEFMYCMECSSCNNTDVNESHQPTVVQTTGEDTNSVSMTIDHHGTRLIIPAGNPVHEHPIQGENRSTLPICRSTLHVQGICCSSEVPTVTQILKQIKTIKHGLVYFPITKVSINITSRLVYVEHDETQTTVDDMVGVLNHEGFGATVRSDGSKERMHDDIHHHASHRLLDNPFTTTSTHTIHESVSDDKRHPSHSSSLKSLKKSRFVESTLVYPAMMSCSMDARAIRRLFKTKKYMPDKIRAFYCQLASKTIKIEHDPHQVSAETVAEQLSSSLLNLDDISSTPWSVQVHIDGAKEGLTLPMHLDCENTSKGDELTLSGHYSIRNVLSWARGFHLNIIFSGIFWVLSMIGELFANLESLKFTGLVSVVFGLPPVCLKAFRTLRRCHFDANCMMVLAAIGATALGEFEEAASVSFLFAISEFLEDRAASQAKESLDSIINLRPDHANLITDPSNANALTIVPTSFLPMGSMVSVRMGDKVPADGIILEGQSYLDESSLTGEATPVERSPGDVVHGGSINVGCTRLLVRTTKMADDSAISRLIRIVEEAHINRSRTETMVDSFARVYTPIVFCLALCMCTIPWIFGYEMGRLWTMNGLIIIVVACPCALTISTPVTYAAGLAAAAHRGVIVKGGCHLESLGNVQTIVLDKTGTITEGKFRLVDLVITSDALKRKEAMELLALMESHSAHPLSATLVNAAQAEGIIIPTDVVVEDHTTLPGEGLSAIVNQKNLYLGNVRLFHRIGYYQNLAEIHKQSSLDWSKSGCTVGYLGVEGLGIVAMFCVSDILRDEAVDVIASLKRMGLDVIMITGDGDGTARSVANEVGIDIDHVHSQCLPEDKMHHIQRLQGSRSRHEITICDNQGLVAMVGDGINDAPALRTADVGIAIGEASALAMEMSDVTFMDSNLSQLIFCLELGRKVISTIRENIGLSVVSKVVVVILTFYHRMTLLWAIASDVGVMLLVTLNGMKPLRSSGPRNTQGDRHPRRKRLTTDTVAYNPLESDGVE